MSIEQNKQVATEFFTRYNANNIDGALDTIADDVNWWLAGKPGQSRVAGPKTKEQMAQIFRTMGEQLKDGLRMAVKSLIAEGDRVALEVESHGELKNGRFYDNEYHVLLTVRGGKISAAREYYDTHHVHAIWFAP
jgi:ketosteroid isomerase-like protein